MNKGTATLLLIGIGAPILYSMFGGMGLVLMGVALIVIAGKV